MTFVIKPTSGPGISAANISTQLPNLFEISKFPFRTLMAQIELDSSIFEKINLKLRKSLLTAGSISLLFLLLFLYLVFEIGFVRRFGTILGTIKNASSDLETGAIPQMTFRPHFLSELKWLSRAFSQFSESLRTYDQKNKEQAIATAMVEKQAALASLAEQVAHDIRSPLAALEMFVDTFDQLPEEPRNSIKGCVSRALDVANTLLDTFKFQTSNLDVDALGALDGPREVVLVSNLIGPIVSEKRVQYSNREGIEIHAVLNAQSYGIFVKMNALKFKRTLSNIIDNAVEAIDGRGEVIVRLSSVEENKTSITVEDNGRGISFELLPKLGVRGTTFGKTSGSGLGLHYAKTFVESAGGKFIINSSPRSGTKVDIILDRAETPEWFVQELNIDEAVQIVVVDDDPSIHHLWEKRFKSENLRKSLLHFYRENDLRQWMVANEKEIPNCLFLCDYEFQKTGHNGLDIIESLNIQENVFLVTTHIENDEIKRRCSLLKIKIIPKVLARFLSIRRIKQ